MLVSATKESKSFCIVLTSLLFMALRGFLSFANTGCTIKAVAVAVVVVVVVAVAVAVVVVRFERHRRYQ